MGERRYLLTGVEFGVLWELLTRHDPPAVLGLDSPGRTHRERRRVCAAAWAALRARGLADATGPDPGLARRLRLLAGPAEQLELRASWDGRLSAVAAGRDGVGVLAVRRADTVLVTGCASVPLALLAALPPGRPGPGRACPVPTAALRAAAGAPGLVAGLVAARVPVAEARLLDRMLSTVERRAQVVAMVEAGPGSGLRRQGGVLGVLDGPRGRYLVTPTVGSDGTEWITVAPCHPRRLRHRVSRLLRPAGRGAG